MEKLGSFIELVMFICLAIAIFCIWTMVIATHTRIKRLEKKGGPAADNTNLSRMTELSGERAKYKKSRAEYHELCAKALNSQPGRDKVASGKTIEEFTQSVKDFHKPLFEAGEPERLMGEERPKPKPNDCHECGGTGEIHIDITTEVECDVCRGTGQANPLKPNLGYAEGQPKTEKHVLYGDARDENVEGRVWLTDNKRLKT